MKRYLLNSAVITSPGLYRYKLLTPEESREWYEKAKVGVASAIGYAETAEALSAILAAPVPVNRMQITMNPGDEALVFRLVLPPGSPRIDPADKGRLSQIVLQRQFELGLLVRLE